MAVDLGDLVAPLKREISPPGTNLFPNAQNSEFLGHLGDAFWEARIAGLFQGYIVNSNDEIVPTSGTDDLPREQQQAIVLYAGYRILLSEFRNLNASTRNKAGPVEREVTKSAQLLKSVLDAIKARIGIVLNQLSDLAGTNVTVLDAVIERDYAQATRSSWWVR